MYNINRSESPWWRYTKDHDLQNGWRYTIDQDLHNGWKGLTYTGIKSRELKSHEHWHDLKEVAYKRCHQSGRSSTQTTMSTCPTMRIKVSRSNIVVDRLITSHWCIQITDARSPTDNENGNQGTKCNLTSVNICVEVKHLEESIDQGTLMYSQKFWWWENLRLMTENYQGTQMTLDSYPRINDLK